MTDLIAHGHALLNAIQALYDAGQYVLALKMVQESILNLVAVINVIKDAIPPVPVASF